MLDPVLLAELLDVRLEGDHAGLAGRALCLAKHAAQARVPNGRLCGHTWRMAETTHLRLALAQIDPTVGDVEGNARLAAEWIERAQRGRRPARGAARALPLRLPARGPAPAPRLPRRGLREALDELAAGVEGIVALVGFPEAVERAGGPRAGDRPPPPRPPTTPSPWSPTARCAASTARCTCPNYGVFDERRYFEPGDEPALIEVDGALVGLDGLRGHLGPRAARERRGRRRRGADRQRLRLALPRAARATSASGWSPSALATAALSFALCNTVGGQDELVFDGHSVVVDPDGELLARAAQFAEELLVCDLLLPRRPARPARRRGAGRRRWSDERRGTRRGTVEPLARRAARRPCGRSTRRWSPACATTSRKNGFERVRARALGRDRLGARRAGRRRRARRRSASRAVIMPSPHSSERDPGRRARDRRQPRHRADRDPDRAERDGAPTSGARASASTGTRARPRRGEPPGAHPRQPADGALEQVRLARAHDRQQVARCRSATRPSTATWPAASR